MATTPATNVETLLHQQRWEEARQLLQKELVREPNNHWLLTQLGVTHYEQGQYQEALKSLLPSLDIVPDCPLTLWNLAGALGALDRPEEAIAIYTGLLRSNKSAADDPCWESDEWTEALKTDCVYRLGVCFQHLGRRKSAEHCFRQYINLLLAGMNGSYSVEDAAAHIRKLPKKGKRERVKEVREVIDSTLQDAGIQSIQDGRSKLQQQQNLALKRR